MRLTRHPWGARAAASPAAALATVLATAVALAAAIAVAAVTVAVAGALVPLGASAAGAAPAGVSYVRLAHLSPDTPPVDVYVTAFSRPQWRLVLRGVGYGQVSPYERVQPDVYTVAMRPAGASMSSPAVLSATVRATAGAAYTVAGLGKRAELGLKVITDNLTLPAPGDSRLRVIQAAASLSAVDIAVDSQPAVITDAGFAAVSQYADVPAGRHMLVVTSSTGSRSPIRLAATLEPNDVYSVLVLDQQGTVALRTQVDAAGMNTVPVGPVETGAGGTAPRGGGPSGALVLSGLVLAAAAVVLARPRRAAARGRHLRSVDR